MNLRFTEAMVILMLLLASCNGQGEGESSQSKEKISLRATADEINLQIPDNFNGQSYNLQYIKERNQLAVFNIEVAEILFFDITSGELEKKIKIAKEGPNGVIRPGGFQYFKRDSLVVTNFMGFHFINGSGEIQSKLLLSDLDNYEEVQELFILNSPQSTPKFEVDFRKDEILIGAQLGGTYEYREDFVEKYKTFPLSLKIIPSENRIEKVDVHYPAELFKGKFSKLNFSRITVGKKQVFSFHSHDLHLWDGQTLRSKKARSEMLKDNLPKIGAEAGFGNIKEMLNFVVFGEGYGSILYDPYRKIYYRFAYGGREDELAMDRVLAELMYPPEQSIVVLDADFNKIDELILPKNEYVLKMSFVHEDGLYVSLHNPKSETLTENEWRFRKLKFE